MRLSKLLGILRSVAKKNGLSKPYIVGGIPRDQAFGVPSEIKDIDITTEKGDSLTLAMATAKIFPDAHFQVFDDGHSSLQFENIQLDFSSNYNIPNIEKELKDMGVNNPTELQKEVYSRDFTINTLLQPTNLKTNPIDITGQALRDIRNKVLRTPINPELTIGHNPIRILRALKLAMKFDLKINPDLKKAIIKYRGGLSEVPTGQIKKQVNEMLDMDPRRAIELLTEYKLLPIIPLSRLLMKELSQQRMVQNLLEAE